VIYHQPIENALSTGNYVTPNRNHSWKKIRRGMFFLKISSCFSVKFCPFWWTFLPQNTNGVCICLTFIRFINIFILTESLHENYIIYISLINTLCVDWLISYQLLLYISNVALISKVINLSNIFRNADFYLIFFCKSWNTCTCVCVTGIITQWLTQTKTSQCVCYK